MSATELLEPVLKGGIRSINFFNGRLLSAEDLSDEQAANRQGRALLGQAVGEGVAGGFEVARSAPGPNQESIVTVSPGLAINRRGQVLRLPAQTDVALSRTSAGTVASAATFKPCVELQGGVFMTDAGVYLLTVAPADGREGRAHSGGLGNTGAPCAARYTVEGVRFRLVQLLQSNELGVGATLRNRVAYDCFGAETLRQYEAAPFGQPPRRYGLLDALRPNTLTDSDVPLALVYWTKQGGVEFVDMWSVRRRPVRPSTTERWGALADDRRVAEAEAMMLQFQEQVAALQGTQGLGNLRAEDRFAYLPPAGLLPVGTGSFNWQTFLGPHAPAETQNLDEGLLRSILARSAFVGPARISPLSSAQAAGQSPPAPYLVYRVPGASDFVLFARSTRGRLRVFLGAANPNVPGSQIYAVAARNNTQNYAAGGAGGIYSIDRLDAGTYTVSVNADGFPDTPVPAVVTAGRTTDVPFTLGAPGSILLTISDRATGQSIGNKVLTVTATPTSGGPPAQGVAVGDKWQVPNLTAGPYAVAVTATGYTTPAPLTIAVAAGQQVPLALQLDAIPVNDAVINLEVSDKTTDARIDQIVQSAKATNAAGAVRNGAPAGTTGLWSITQLAAGTYSVEVTALNYQKETVAGVTLTTSQRRTLPVQLTATPGSVALNVTNATTGVAIDDKVTAVTATLGATNFPGTKSGTKWSIPNLPPGTYSVQVTATDFTTKNTTGVVVQAGQTNTLTVALQPVAAPAGSINLTVTDEMTGAAIDDKVTAVSATSGSLTFPGTKSAAGKWSITNLPPGTYSVEVRATNYNTKTVPGVAVTSGAVLAVTVPMQPQPGSIVLTATDSATGANIDNKVTSLSATNVLGQPFNGVKDAAGKWSIASLPPGTYSVTVTATNYTNKTTAGVVVASATANNLTVSLVAVPGSMRLTVTDALTGANIDNTVSNATATNAAGQNFPGTKVSGKWTITNLAPGAYSVTTAAPGYDQKTVSNIQVASAAEAAPSVQMSPTRGTVSLTLQRLNLPASGNSFRASVSAPGNQSLTADFVNDQCTISNVNPGTLTVTVSRIGGNYPGTVFALTLAPGGTASRTIKLTPLGVFFARTNVQTTFDHNVISPQELVSVPGGTPQLPEIEAREWLNVWRDWVALTRPDRGIATGTDARTITTSTSRPSVEETLHEGVAVFFNSAGGVVAAIRWSKMVTTNPDL